MLCDMKQDLIRNQFLRLYLTINTQRETLHTSHNLRRLYQRQGLCRHTSAELHITLTRTNIQERGLKKCKMSTNKSEQSLRGQRCNLNFLSADKQSWGHAHVTSDPESWWSNSQICYNGLHFCFHQHVSVLEMEDLTETVKNISSCVYIYM